MKAVRFHRHGGSDVLDVEEVDRPTPTAGEVVVNVRAAGVNPVDVKYRERKADPLPMTAGSDFAGTVEAVGDRVTGFERGDRVFGTGLHNNAVRTGTYAEYVAVPSDLVAHLPADVDFVEGAAVPLVGVTAWRGLVDRAALAPGETCLVHGGNGGVGHVAIQLARIAGAHTVATAAPTYHSRLESLGADVTLDYDVPTSDLREAVVDVAGDGVDVVLDHRLEEYAQFDVDVTGFGARVVGIDGDAAHVTNAGVARGKELTVHHVGMDNLLHPELPSMASVLRRIGRLVATGKLEVEVARTYPLAEAPDAQTAAVEESFLGKVVLVT